MIIYLVLLSGVLSLWVVLRQHHKSHNLSYKILEQIEDLKRQTDYERAEKSKTMWDEN